MLSGLFAGVLRKLLKGFEKHFFELTIRVMACLKLPKRERERERLVYVCREGVICCTLNSKL